MTDTTTVTVSRDTWKDLYDRKDPGDTFDDVIRRLMDSEARVE